MKVLLILFQALTGIAAAAAEVPNWEKIGFLGTALLAVVVLWRKQEKSDNNYRQLLERVINLENNSAEALKENTEAINKLSELIEKKLN